MENLVRTTLERRESVTKASRMRAFKAASVIFRDADEPHYQRIFEKLASSDPGPVADPIALAVLGGLGKGLGPELFKTASGASAVLGPFLRLGGFLVPNTANNALAAAKLLMLAGVTAGGVGGAGVFGAQRLMESENEETLKLQQRKSMMKRLSEDVKRELELRNLKPTPDNTAAAVDYLT